MSAQVRVSHDPQLVEALRAAVIWLDAEQPAEALLTHHGLTANRRFAGDVSVSFAPVGYEGHPVLAFERMAEWHNDELINGFTQVEVDQLRAMVAEVTPIAAEWNGAPHASYSVALKVSSGRGPRRLLGNYRAGCPKHHTQTCATPGQGDCRWYRDGLRLAIRPDGWS